MKKHRLLACALSTITLSNILCAPIMAKDRIGMAIGYYDLFHKEGGVNLHLEYKGLNTKLLGSVSPFAGAELNNKGSLWIGAGALTELNLTPKWMITPSIAIGYYNRGNATLDLGHPIEFRTALELSYEFKNANRIGLSLTHMSNAGLGEKNPGIETLSLHYSIPFNKIF